jgi:hypothetical protein
MQTAREEKIVAFQRQVYIERAAENWKRKMAVLKDAEADAEAAKAELLDACGQQPFEGKGVKVEEIERKGVIEWTVIPELKNLNLEQYRKPSAKYWKISLSLVQ